MAYEVKGLDLVRDAWNSLFNRECKSGGYRVEVVPFYTKDCSCPPEEVLTFRATPECDLYMGESPEDEMANQIYDSKGPAGYNIEYVMLLYQYLLKYMPCGLDNHMKALKSNLEIIAKQRGEDINQYVKRAIPEDETFTACQKCSGKIQVYDIK